MRDEKEALNFIPQNTSILVPRVITFTEADAISAFTIEMIKGTWMEELIKRSEIVTRPFSSECQHLCQRICLTSSQKLRA